jgi:hypothetical protein
MEELRYKSRYIDLGTRSRWVISFLLKLHYSEEWALSTHWIEVWVGPRGSLEAVEYTNISCPYREYNPSCPASNPSLYRLRYPVSFIKVVTNYTIFKTSWRNKLSRKFYLHPIWFMFVNYSRNYICLKHVTLTNYSRDEYQNWEYQRRGMI